MRLESLDDGSRLEASWNDALNTSLSYFRALLASSNSSAWKPVKVLPLTTSSVARDDGQSSSKGSSLGRITANDVRVSRRTGKSGEVFRAVVDLECGSDVSVDIFRGCLATPETRPTWDRMVEEAETLELLDAHTRVTKTKYRLGWPSSPRDAITLGKTLVDQRTLIDISTSLPRSRHEPVYLRPAPPYVRAHVSLLAWCIQLPGSSTDIAAGKARITCFWSWNPKGTWAVGGGVPQHLPSVVVGLVDQVREGSERVPVLLGYGPDVAIGAVSYDASRVTLSVGYAIVHGGENSETEGLRRQVEFGVSSTQSWDVQIHVKTQHGEDSPSTVWSSFVGQAPSYEGVVPSRLILRFAHAILQQSEELVRVKVSIERTSSATSGVRINGIPVTIESMEPTQRRRPLLEETASTSGVSLRTVSTMDVAASNDPSSERARPERAKSERSQAVEKGIAALVRHFTSLLQEPEPKWRPVLDSRGVAIHQLNSIDKTLIVFRAEAVFVGVGIWDLFATIASPGARLVWDKSHDEAILLEDVNELTDLWHFKSKAAWPVSARDSVMLRTTYKSPSSVHIFGFSVDDADLFQKIPPVIDPTVIRTQIDLQGWSIESLSPNTTHVALVEQSDPRGWSNKSSIPQVMMSTLAGIGEFAIKHGAPPITTRLGGARAVSTRYDVEKETFRFEYENAEARRSGSSGTSTAFPLPVAVRNIESEGETTSLKSLDYKRPITNIECEIRCDADRWTNNFVVTIDPPHTALSALKRHRLSAGGGGLWLTIEHDPVSLGKEKIVIIVRKGVSISGAKTAVTANGHKVKVDIEDLPETDANLLKKQKRSRPSRAPLDQPAALGTLRKKQSSADMSIAPSADTYKSMAPLNSYNRIAMPLARLYSYAADTTRAAIVPMGTPGPRPQAGSTPADAVVRALGQVARIHRDREGESTDPHGWQPVSDRDGLKIEKRLLSHVSESFPVYRAGRIIEGFTAEEVSSAISALQKDEQFDAPLRLETHGHGIITSQITAFTTFPFRPRNMVVATIIARAPDGPPPSPSVSNHSSLSTIFHASTSAFDVLSLDADPAKYNPSNLPSGNVILEGWIIETIDPYSHEQYAIPSTRCMYVAAADYSGNIPLSVNNMLNSCLPRSLLSVEASLKSDGPPSRLRSPTMAVLMPDTTSQGPWSLEGVDDKVCVDERIAKDDYSTIITIAPASERSDNLSPPLRHNDSRTSVTSNRSTVIDLGEDIRRGRKDLTVLEVDIGQAMAKSGCDIFVRGISLPIAQNSESNTLSFDLPQQQLDLPFRVSVTALAPSALQSASLDPSASPRHLLRVTLPTSEYEAPVNDPLTGKSGPLPRPRWLLDLLNDGAVIQLKLKARPGSGGTKYLLDDVEIPVEEEKRGRSFSRDTRSKLPQLVNRSTRGAKSLEKPLAVARNLMRPAPVAAVPEVPIDVPEEPAVLEVDTVPEVKPEEPVVARPLPAPPSRYTFWKYPYPRLGRFSSSAPTTATSSPITTTIATLVPELASTSSLSAAQPDSPLDSTDLNATSTKPKVNNSNTSIDTKVSPLLTVPGLLLCCLLSLLLGSLLRSLLSEADFVIHLPHDSAAAAALSGSETWRELRRLAEWRIGWDRDLIVAIVKR